MKRALPWAVLILVVSLIAGGIGLIAQHSDQADTKSQADDASKTAGVASAAADKNTDRIAQLEAEQKRLKAEQAREAAERARLRALIVTLGGNPGPDLKDSNQDGDKDLGSSTTPSPQPAPRPTTRPSPRRSPSPAPSPSPSPTCLLKRPLSICRQ